MDAIQIRKVIEVVLSVARVKITVRSFVRSFVRSCVCVCVCVCVCEDNIDLIPRCVCLGRLSGLLSFQPNQPKLFYHLSVVSVVLSIL